MNFHPGGEVVGVGWLEGELCEIETSAVDGGVVARGAVLLNEGVGPGKWRRRCDIECGGKGGCERDQRGHEEHKEWAVVPWFRQVVCGHPHSIYEINATVIRAIELACCSAALSTAAVTSVLSR